MVPHNVQIVGQSLLLECIVTTVRGIASTMDITWSTDNVMLQTERNISINYTTLYTASYSSNYIIPQLSTLDDDRVYRCEVVINGTPPVPATGRIEMDVIGKYNYICSLLYHIAGEFGRENIWHIYSFQAFGGKSLTNK